MKKIIYLIYFIIIQGFGQESDTSILEKTVTKIYDIETVKHQSTFQAIESGKIYSDRTDTIFFDFGLRNIDLTPRYYFKGSESELIYDGKRHIMSSLSERNIVTNDAPNANNPLLLTLYSVKKLLPQLMTNQNVKVRRNKDTLIDKKRLYAFSFNLKDERIDWDKLILESYAGAETEITLMISMSDYFPRKMIMDNGPSGKMSRTYDNFDFEYTPNDKVWTGELLPKDYSRMTFKEYFDSKMKAQSTKINSSKSKISRNMRNWKLPLLKTNDIADFSKLTGNVILLEFWFKNCGPCVKVIPNLNALNEKYKNEKFKLYGIEFREDFSQENLLEYVKNMKMAYPTLYKGKDLADDYGIRAAPTFILINKQGDVIYNKSGFNEEEITKLIDNNMK